MSNIYNLVNLNGSGPGLLSPQHWIFIAIWLSYAIGLATLLIMNKHREKIMLVLFIVIWTFEVGKIVIVTNTDYRNVNGYVPLHFSSIFLYAAALSLSKNKLLKTTGQSFLSTGSVVGGLAFTLWPSTALADHPLWNHWALHSGFFHATMLAVGVATLVKLYRPNKAMDGLKYMVLVSIISVLAIMVNETTQSVGIPGNLMFYHSAPQEIHFLKVISDTSLALWIFIAWAAQAVVIYWGFYGVCKLIDTIKEKKGRENLHTSKGKKHA